MVKGVLFESRTRKGSKKLFVYISSTVRADVLYACHDHPIAGHTGFARTRDRVVSRFYFSCMLHYVRNYVEACEACQARNSVAIPPSSHYNSW